MSTRDGGETWLKTPGPAERMCGLCHTAIYNCQYGGKEHYHHWINSSAGHDATPRERINVK